MSELRSPFWKEKITKGRVLLLKVMGLLSGRRPSFQPPSHDSKQGGSSLIASHAGLPPLITKYFL